MNSVEKIINTFSYGGLFLTAAALVVSVICFILFLRSRTDLSTKEEILADEMDDHRKKRKAFIAFLVITALSAGLTASAFLVKSAASSFSYVFFPMYSTTRSGDTLSVSTLTEYETEVTAAPNVITEKATLSVGETWEYTFTAKAKGDYLLSIIDMADGLKLDVTIRDKKGVEIYAESDVRDYGVAVVEDMEKGQRYTVAVTATKGSGRFEIEIIEPKSFDIKHYTAIKDSIEHTDQCNLYYYTAPWDGVYSFFLTDVDYRCDISVSVPDATELLYEDEETATVRLTGGTTYAVRVEQQKGYCQYTLNVMRQKDTVDIGKIKTVNDSFEFCCQHNRYSFSGRTEIELNFQAGDTRATVMLMDEKGNIVYEGITVGGDQRVAFPDLEKNNTYLIVVASQSGEGEYSFSIE